MEARNVLLDPEQAEPLVIKTIVWLVTSSLHGRRVEKAGDTQTVAEVVSSLPLSKVGADSLDAHRNHGLPHLHTDLHDAPEIILRVGAAARGKGAAVDEGQNRPRRPILGLNIGNSNVECQAVDIGLLKLRRREVPLNQFVLPFAPFGRADGDGSGSPVLA